MHLVRDTEVSWFETDKVAMVSQVDTQEPVSL